MDQRCIWTNCERVDQGKRILAFLAGVGGTTVITAYIDLIAVCCSRF